MNRQIAMVIAGFVTTVAVIGGTVAAAQSGILSTSTTTIQTNGDINAPKMAQQPVVAEPTATTEVQATATPEIEIITQTEVIPIQYITKTVVVEKRDTSREAALMLKLNQAYQVIKDRDAAYQAKLQDAYNKLAAAQQLAPPSDNSQASSPAPSNPPSSNPPPAAQPPTEQHPTAQPPTEQHPTEQHPTAQPTPQLHHDDEENHSPSPTPVSRKP